MEFDPIEVDINEELERLAANALLPETELASRPPTKDEVQRWVGLFHYTPQEASYLINSQRMDVTRSRISDSHWEIVKEDREARGYDKEAYEHELSLRELFSSQGLVMSGVFQKQGDAVFVFRLGGLLSTAEDVQRAAGLKSLPHIVKGWGEMGEVEFCCVEWEAKEKIEDWLAQAQARGKGTLKQDGQDTNASTFLGNDEEAKTDHKLSLPQPRPS